MKAVPFSGAAPGEGTGSLNWKNARCAGRANPIELIAVVLFGAAHVVLEVLSDGTGGTSGSITRPQHFFNLASFIIWGAYLLWRVAGTRGIAAEWGFQRAGFLPALRAGAVFAMVAACPLIIYGWLHSRFPLPGTFWLVAVLYPAWGLGQQFALQALITKNLREIVPGLWFRILAASTIFSAAHFPNYWLMGLTLAAGMAFTWIFERYRNIWAVGIVHGFLGAAAYYLVLGQDPGAELLRLFR